MDTKAERLGFCRFCGQKMKIVRSINNGNDISRLRACMNTTCSKESYMTREVHPARFEFLERCERQRIVSEHTPAVVEYSYERALTPVEPAPATPNWKFPDWNDYADRHEPAQRAHYEAAVANWNAEHPHLARSPAPWVKQTVEESNKMTDDEAALARDIAQNKAYYALKAELDRRLHSGEINTDEYDRYLRELYE